VYILLLAIILLCLNAGTNLTTHPLFMKSRFIVFFTAFAMVPAIPGFYIFYGLLFSRFLERKKILAFFLAMILISLLCGIAGALALSVLAWYKIGVGIFNDGLHSAIPVTVIMSIIALLNGVVGLVMKGFVSWYNDIKLKEELTRKNHETELALVKSQLDPHFLFNTINNIDVLIEKDAIRASAYLNKLSHIMRFMLYETRSEKISLHQELEYIEKYIELQRIRNANPNSIQYTVEGSVQNIFITPMLFIPFIENAFKHSTNRKVERAVNIHFAVEPHRILFECENTCGGSNGLTHSYKGLGNELIRKRLDLLYPGKHRLSVNDMGTAYKVTLDINCQ
jgi:hypothetical protein